YTKTISGYYANLVREIQNNGFPLQPYLPLYKKELGVTVSIAFFCADSVFWLFFVRSVTNKIKKIDIAFNDTNFSIDWLRKSPDETRRENVMARLSLIAPEILAELIIPGGEPFILF